MNVLRIHARQGLALIDPFLAEYWTERGLIPNDQALLQMQAQAAMNLCDPAQAWWAAVEGEDCHGFIGMKATLKWRNGGSVAIIEDFYIPPESRGTTESGVMLYGAAVRWARENGIRFVEANVALSNVRVVTILSKYGFNPRSTLFSKDLNDGRTKRRRRGRGRREQRRPGELEAGDSAIQGHRGADVREPTPQEGDGLLQAVPGQPVHVHAGTAGRSVEPGSIDLV